MTEKARPVYFVSMSKGAATRNTILCKGLALASKVGLEGLTIGRLAKAAGMSKSGLFGHFDSKEHLQLEVLDTAVQHFILTVITPALRRPRGVPRVQAMFENWLRWSKDEALPGGCVFIGAANEMDDRPGPVRDRLVEYQNEWIDSLATTARSAVKAGDFHPDLDCRQFAYDFYSIILAYHHFSRLIRDDSAEDRARRSFGHLLQASSASGHPTVASSEALDGLNDRL